MQKATRKFNDPAASTRREFSLKMLKAGGIAAVAGYLPRSAVAAEVRPAAPPAAEVFDVLSYGAVRDGSTMSTQAIQKAIDACAKAGGGVVHFPPGEYLSGGIVLRSGVYLDFSAGSILKGSTHLSDYPQIVAALRSYTDSYVNRSLIYGENLDNVGLTGKGIIDGQGHAFHGAYDRTTSASFPLILRPFVVRLVQCRNVTVRDITLRNSPGWMHHYLACEDLLVDGITVSNLPNGDNRSFYNNDGIDVDSCQRVRIANCSFRTEDDALCFKSTTSAPCRDIAVSNCIIMSQCNGIKWGTESEGGFQNVTISNCAIYKADLAGISLGSTDGGTLDGVVISDIVMRDVNCPFLIQLGDRGRPVKENDPKPGIGSMRNIRIANLVATGANVACSISGLPDHSLENISLAAIRIEFADSGTAQNPRRTLDEKTSDSNKRQRQLEPAYGLFARHVRNLLFDHVDLTTATSDLKPAIWCSDAENVEVCGLRSLGQKQGAPLIGLEDTRGALVHDCWVPDAGGTLIQVRGPKSSRIRICCNNRDIKETDVDIGGEVPTASVSYSER